MWDLIRGWDVVRFIVRVIVYRGIYIYHICTSCYISKSIFLVFCLFTVSVKASVSKLVIIVDFPTPSNK